MVYMTDALIYVISHGTIKSESDTETLATFYKFNSLVKNLTLSDRDSKRESSSWRKSDVFRVRMPWTSDSQPTIVRHKLSRGKRNKTAILMMIKLFFYDHTYICTSPQNWRILNCDRQRGDWELGRHYSRSNYPVMAGATDDARDRANVSTRKLTYALADSRRETQLRLRSSDTYW